MSSLNLQEENEHLDCGCVRYTTGWTLACPKHSPESEALESMRAWRFLCVCSIAMCGLALAVAFSVV